MAIDATGTPTALGIPKYNTATDPPSGKGFNAAMDALDALITARVAKASFVATGDILYASSAGVPARLAVGTNGHVLTLAGGIPSWAAAVASNELAYQEFTGTVTRTNVAEGSAPTIVTAPAFTADGTSAYVVEFFAPRWTAGSAPNASKLYLYQDGSSIGHLADIDGADSLVGFAYGQRRLIPSAGSRTYSIRGTSSAGDGTVVGAAGGSGNFVPGFIRVSRA